jgi:DNA-binding SARP family transcriptional activator
MLFEIKRRLSIYYFEHKDYPKAVDHLRQLMAVKPFSKENLALLMRSLAGMGDIQGVKEQYLIYVKKFFEEFGSSPPVEIKALYNNIRNPKKVYRKEYGY